MSQEKKGRPTPSRKQRAAEQAERAAQLSAYHAERFDVARTRTAVARMATDVQHAADTAPEPEHVHENRWADRASRRAAARKGIRQPNLNNPYVKPEEAP